MRALPAYASAEIFRSRVQGGALEGKRDNCSAQLYPGGGNCESGLRLLRFRNASGRVASLHPFGQAVDARSETEM